MANLFIKGIEVPERSYLDNNFFTQTYINNTFYTKEATDSNFLSKTNTTSYAPTGNYNPATKKYVDDCIAAINQLHFEIVEELPQVGESTIIYMILADDGEGEDYYDEYIYINNTWEKIGSTRIDLSPYATKEYVNSELAAVPEMLATNAAGELDLTNCLAGHTYMWGYEYNNGPTSYYLNVRVGDKTTYIVYANDPFRLPLILLTIPESVGTTVGEYVTSHASSTVQNTFCYVWYAGPTLENDFNHQLVANRRTTLYTQRGNIYLAYNSWESMNLGGLLPSNGGSVSTNGTVNFDSHLPISSIVPDADNQLVNKKYVDDALDNIDLSKVAGFINLYNYSSSNPLVLSTLEPGLYILSGTGFSGASLTMVARPGNRSTTIFDFDLSKLAYLVIQEKIPEVYDRRRTAYIVMWGINQGYYTLTDDGYSLTHQWSLSKEFLTASTNQTITGKKTFNQLPESSVAPTTNNQLSNKKYVDDSINNIDLTSYATKDYVDEGDFVILDLTDYLYGNIWEGSYNRNSLPQNDTNYNFTVNDTDNVNKLLKIARDLYAGKTPKAIVKFKYREADNTSTYWTTTAPAHFSRYVDTHDWYLFFTGTNAKPTNALWYHSLFSSFNASITLPNDDTVTSFTLDAAVSSDLPMYKGDVLKRNNTDSYTPVGNYNPATKLYVDQNIFNPTLGLSKPIDWPTDFTSVTVDVTAVEDSEGNAVAELDYDPSTGLYSIYNHEPEAFKYYVNKFTFTNNTDSDAVIYFKHRTCLDGFRWLAISKLDTDLECRSGYGINENDCEYFCNNKEDDSVLLTTFVIPANSSHYVIAQIEDMSYERASDYLAEFSIGEMVKRQVATEQYVNDHTVELPKYYVLAHGSYNNEIPTSQYSKLVEIVNYYLKYNSWPYVSWNSDSGCNVPLNNVNINKTTNYVGITFNLGLTPAGSNSGTSWGISYRYLYGGSAFTIYVKSNEFEEGEVINVYSDAALQQQTRISVGYSGGGVARVMAPNTNLPLGTNNTVSYTPSGDYNPATKKYVDDNMPKMVVLTQAEYDALATKDQSTYYFIKEDETNA